MPVTVYENQTRLNWINAGWVAATAYVVHDALLWNGTSYRCVLAHTSAATTEPGVGATWTTAWAVVAAKGTTGSAGTNGTNGAISQLQDEGTNQTVRGTVDFVGAGVTVTDDAVTPKTIVTIPGGGGGGGGAPLAWVSYNPTTPVVKDVSSTTLAAFDTTNLRVSFVVPSTGIVVVTLEATCYLPVAAVCRGAWGLLEGATQKGDIVGVLRTNAVMELRPRIHATIRITGLTPSADLTWDWAAISNAAGTVRLMAGSDISSTNFGGPAIMAVYAA